MDSNYKLLQNVLQNTNLIHLAPLFEENELTDDILPEVTTESIKEILPILGQRLKFMKELSIQLKSTSLNEISISEANSAAIEENMQLENDEFVNEQENSKETVEVRFVCEKHFTTLSSLWTHLKLVHGGNTGYGVLKCFKCKALFDRSNAYLKHLGICREKIETNDSQQQKCNLKLPENISIYESAETDSNVTTHLEVDCVQLTQKLIEKQFSTILTKLLKNKRVPHSLAIEIINHVRDLLNIIKIKLIQPIAGENYEDVLTCFLPIDKLYTTSSLKKYAFENENAVKPEQIFLDSKVAHGPIVNQCTAIQSVKYDTMQCVSIKKTMEILINNPVFMQLHKKHLLNIEDLSKIHPEIICDYRNGSQYKNTDVMLNTIFILLYIDEVEICNLLGSRAGKSKLTMIYFCLKDLPSFCHSQLDNIKLVAVLKSSDLKTYGYQLCLKKLVSELQELDTVGVNCELKEYHHKYTVRVAQIVGDNLGLHSILGFTESFSANFPCRFCKLNKSECKKLTRLSENKTILRNVENYNFDLNANILSETGIKESCVFSALRYFNVTKNLAVDFMHDILEGVAQYDLSYIMESIFNRNLISLEELNSRIECYDYCRVHQKNRPPKFKTQTFPKFSASQMSQITI